MKIIILTIIIGCSSLLFAETIRDSQLEIVADTTTGLYWQDDEEVKSNSTTWQNAIIYCEGLTLGSYEDWRVANINELLSISDDSKASRAIIDGFVNVVATNSSFYWSSTTYASNTSYAWVVDFNYGGGNYGAKSNSRFVRCVRGGQ